VIIFRVGGFTVVWFGLLAAAGAALSAWLVLARQQQVGMEPDRFAAPLYLLLPLLAVLGSRLLVLAMEWRDLLSSPLRTLRRAGFAWQGGFIAGTAGLIWLAIVHRLDFLLLADCFALSLPAGHMLGRLGCHSYGCCHGRPTESRLAIRYTHPASKAVRLSGLAGVPLHPVQAYSAVANLGIFVLLCALARGETRPGALGACYLLLDGLGRFLLEFLRGIPVKRLLGLSLYQCIALGLMAAGALLLWYSGWRPSPPVAWPAGSLLPALGFSAARWWYPAWVFVLFFASFGIHGRDVGRL